MTKWCEAFGVADGTTVTQDMINKFMDDAKKGTMAVIDKSVPDIPFADIWISTTADTMLAGLRKQLEGFKDKPCGAVPQDIGTPENLIANTPGGIGADVDLLGGITNALLFLGVLAIALVLIVVAAKLVTTKGGKSETE